MRIAALPTRGAIVLGGVVLLFAFASLEVAPSKTAPSLSGPQTSRRAALRSRDALVRPADGSVAGKAKRAFAVPPSGVGGASEQSRGHAGRPERPWHLSRSRL